MLKNFYINFSTPKLTLWSRIILLSSSLFVMFLTFKNIPFSRNKSKSINRKKEKSMIDRVEIFFNELKINDPAPKTNILIKDTEKCREKILTMIRDGVKYLQIISDFDRTISCYSHNGRPNLTCHGVFEMDPELSEEVRLKFNNLREKYYNIEVNSSMTNEEKVPFMVEWWTKAHDLMVDSGLHRDVLESTVKDCEIGLRSGCFEFMTTLDHHEIPILIFSAGVGNVISEILKLKQLLYDNVRIVSNFMNFNKEGILTGFQDDVIHTFNKSARSIQDSEFYENICTKRKNVILMGDSTGDPQMSDGLSDDVNVLKIGFLNCDVENLKENYMDIYDIVLISDESFAVPMKILQLITNQEF